MSGLVSTLAATSSSAVGNHKSGGVAMARQTKPPRPRVEIALRALLDPACARRALIPGKSGW
jgi:hypothetical protein